MTAAEVWEIIEQAARDRDPFLPPLDPTGRPKNPWRVAEERPGYWDTALRQFCPGGHGTGHFAGFWLTPQERAVLGLRFGDRYTLKAIAANMGVCPERIRQIQAKGLRKIRQHLGVQI